MSTTADEKNRAKQLAADQALIDGLGKHGQAIGALLIGGKAYKAADLTPILQARIAASKAVSPARSVWLAAVLAEKNERATTKTLVAGLRQALITAYTAMPDTLADFGLTPRKKPVVTAQTKAGAAVKAKTTRGVLGTKGTKQKKVAKKATGGTTAAPPPTGTPPTATPPAQTPQPATAPTVTPAPAPAPRAS
jgi:hypothetical protein